MQARYPFAALVGQERLQDALVWLAVDPRIGGLLITGTRGTAKSTAARALADLLPSDTPFVELPVGATEDRVVGTLDVRTLLADGRRRFEPGLLARANRGVLYVDEVNLLPDHIVDVLLDAAAMGVNVVERDGASHTHEARIMLIGSMNPEEGELRPQLLDRFGLCVAVENDDDTQRRAEITARRIAFDLDPDEFCAHYAAQSQALRERVSAARALLASVAADRACLEHAARLAIDAHVEGMRADLTIVRAARAVAALESRSTVRPEDLERVAEAALAHRRREVTPPPPPPKSRDGDAAKERQPNDAPDSPNPHREPPLVFDVGAMMQISATEQPPAPAGVRARRAAHSARGRSAVELARGAARTSARCGGPPAPLATVRAALLDGVVRDGGALHVDVSHLRYVHRYGRERQLLIFVVDASGSMAAAARMRAAKGAVCGLLEEAYQRRDAVALIAFRGEGAELLVPPTRSALLAYRRLRAMPTGGRTPLAHALRLAQQTALQYARREPAARSHVVVVSDARANVPERGAFSLALRYAAALREDGVRALCIDTEVGRIRLGNAVRLSDALGATYRHIGECTERALGAAVREWMAVA